MKSHNPTLCPMNKADWRQHLRWRMKQCPVSAGVNNWSAMSVGMAGAFRRSSREDPASDKSSSSLPEVSCLMMPVVGTAGSTAVQQLLPVQVGRTCSPAGFAGSCCSVAGQGCPQGTSITRFRSCNHTCRTSVDSFDRSSRGASPTDFFTLCL